MPFTTLSFIGFFATFFFVYYAVPKRFQWWLLLTGSMVFYGYASPYYLLLLWATILVTFVGAVAIGSVYRQRDEYLAQHKAELSRDEKKTCKAKAEANAKRWLVGTILVLVLMLGVFKYAQFAIDNLFALLGLFGIAAKSDLTFNVLLPVGLSFYVFQSMGYCIDVYREEVPPERNLFKHALFVSFFPQLLQGPIGNYGRLAPQLLSSHVFDHERVVLGLQRVAWGFFKKLVIANRIAHFVNPVWTSPCEYSGFLTWFFFCFMYAVQIYADFSGYMDVACGCSQMLGVKIDENFNCPYFSKTIPEFWRCWHMTLSEWFKNYLFYPLLRVNWNSKIRKLFVNKYLSSVMPTTIALTIVWSVIGLWHGASWGYVAYGIYYGFFMIIAIVMAPVYERLHTLKPGLFGSKLYIVFQMLRTFAIVVIGYSIFKPADLSVTAQIWQSSASLGHDAFWKVWQSHPTGWIVFMVWASLLAAVDLIHLRFGAGAIRMALRRMPTFARNLCYIVFLLILCYGGLFFPKVVEFEYFKF